MSEENYDENDLQLDGSQASDEVKRLILAGIYKVHKISPSLELMSSAINVKRMAQVCRVYEFLKQKVREGDQLTIEYPEDRKRFFRTRIQTKMPTGLICFRTG